MLEVNVFENSKKYKDLIRSINLKPSFNSTVNDSGIGYINLNETLKETIVLRLI